MVSRLLLAALGTLLTGLPALGQATPPRLPSATPVSQIKIKKDFRVELLYTVPKESQGSWVSMCNDEKGRLIVSDQYGPLYRITPPALGGKAEDTKVEKLDVPLGEAQGLLWAFDALYVVVNRGARYESGLYKVTASKGDDHLDTVQQLRRFVGGAGEHGPHAVVLGPDQKSLYIVCGNQTKMLDSIQSRVPRHWGEDHLIPRMPDGNGFMAGVLGPGGCVYRTDPDGKEWELQSTGYRNPYDIAFNRFGDLFTWDADMEWDINTPWYRPTRICLVASGTEYGWRNGSGKYPPHYLDTWPAVLDIGPGSPTGIAFGYKANFPTKYQEALFMCDWSYGKLYAVHLTPDGAGYKGEAEEFLNGSPLPLTDIVVNKDGALYFTIGGRKTQSGLYRVTYTGKESTKPLSPEGLADLVRKNMTTMSERRVLETYHHHLEGAEAATAISLAWPRLNNPDRFIRSAARVVLEHQDAKLWQQRALAEQDPERALQALLALVRVTSNEPQHKELPPLPVDEALRGQILAALGRLDWAKLTDDQRVELLRVYGILFVRTGGPNEELRKQLIARFDPHYPASWRVMNSELCQMLVYLQAPDVAAKTLKLLATAPTQEEQLEYARCLRVLKTGWTQEQRKEYLTWFLKASHFHGGASLKGFMRNIKGDAVASMTPEDKKALKELVDARVDTPAPVPPAPPRPFVKKWTVAELTPLVEKGLQTKRDFERGRAMVGAANCFACHRFASEGASSGPDLTGAGGRFSIRDLLESIVEPSKEISDQYAAVIINTKRGKTVIGRIVNLHDDNLSVMTNMLDPNGLTNVKRSDIDSMETSKVSMMPEGLLDTLKEDEIVDLVAYLLSRGDRTSKYFK